MRLLRFVAALLALVTVVTVVTAQEQAPNRREFTIVAKDHQFTPNRMDVSQDDIVRVTLRAEGRTYSFAIDAYRIVKRVAAGETITFEFRADQPGTFDFYCSLTSDPECPGMRGTMTVKGK
ncbi:MAG: cupredoxin domain-containing protein [Acidobacteria bacterium]|nr:cupredoxin domain-containing protein [Acidobacteriota bacterium]